MGINLTKHQSELLSVSICIALLLLIYFSPYVRKWTRIIQTKTK